MSDIKQASMDYTKKIDNLALFIAPDRTIAEADEILKTLFNGKNMISLDGEYEIESDGIHFVIAHYAEEWEQIWNVVNSIPGLEIDEEEMMDWEVD